jgi:HlyD family secretion protein
VWPQRRLLLIAATAIVIAIAAVWKVTSRPQVRVATAAVTSGRITRPIVATGTLQPVTTVEIGSQISGTVQWLGADFNSLVRKNDIVLRLDPSIYQAQLAEARANLGQAQADELRLKAVLEDAQTKLSRAETLGKRQLITQSDLDAARLAVDQAAPDVKAAHSVVVQAQARLDQAALDLQHTIIRSPVDGVVVERDVDMGQTVAATIASPVLFRIATDLKKMQVQVQVDESDVAAVTEGNRATFEVGSYPDLTFNGVVSQVRLQPVVQQPNGSSSGSGSGASSSSSSSTIAGASTTATSASPATPAGSVVSYTAIVDVANVDEKLRPGMTAEVTFGGFTRENAVRIPNSALAFRPPINVLEAIRQPDIPATSGKSETRQVWKYQSGRFVPVDVQSGLADDRWTELLKGNLHPGDQLVTNATLARQ